MDTLQSNSVYHIYNHAVGEDYLFREEDNYLFFLKRYAEYIHPIAHTYAYCLMPNHFHVLVRIRAEDELEKLNLQGFKNLEGFKANRQFSNLFNSYSKAYNKHYERRGALFCHNFKRKHISNENYLSNVIYYIHYNPIHHGFCNSMDDWYWSSYHTYLNDKKTLLEKSVGLESFGGKDNFIRMHHDRKTRLELSEEDYY